MSRVIRSLGSIIINVNKGTGNNFMDFKNNFTSRSKFFLTGPTTKAQVQDVLNEMTNTTWFYAFYAGNLNMDSLRTFYLMKWNEGWKKHTDSLK